MSDKRDDEYWPHTLTVNFLIKEKPWLLGDILSMILNEAALTSRQGGSLNYYWMLEQIAKINKEDNNNYGKKEDLL